MTEDEVYEAAVELLQDYLSEFDYLTASEHVNTHYPAGDEADYDRVHNWIMQLLDNFRATL